jgi:hypothetical protein
MRNNFARPTLLWAMRTRLHDYEDTRIALPSYLAVFLSICGILGWGFYTLMQPAQYQNPGVAVYKAPPGLGRTSLPPVPLTHKREVPLPNEAYLAHNPDETTGRAIHNAEAEPAVAAVPAPQDKTPPRKRENTGGATREMTRQVQRTAPIQSHPFGGFGAAYPGYAALH